MKTLAAGMFIAENSTVLPSSARMGIVWFLVIFLLLGLLLLTVVLLTASRMRQRTARKSTRPETPSQDAWVEAGRRMKLEEEGPKE
ncbi:MAG TPA: hypothetical protein VG711_09850 [Phycisphaerales bacterium]|nr:hypothetical protein [Phycisphaerales bacterium]